MTFCDPNPRFKVTVYLKVEYLRQCKSFQLLYKEQLYITKGSTENVQKIGGRRWIFFAKSARRCFTSLIEIKHNSVSVRWNF